MQPSVNSSIWTTIVWYRKITLKSHYQNRLVFMKSFVNMIYVSGLVCSLAVETG